MSAFGFLRKGRSSHALLFDNSDLGAAQPSSAHQQIVLEGALIRKHVLIEDGERASSRRWIKFWCSIRIQKDGGADLILNKLSYQYTADKEFTDGEVINSLVHYSTEPYPSLEEAEKHAFVESPLGTPNNQHFQLAVEWRR